MGRVLLWPAGVALGLVAERAYFGWDDPRGWIPDLVVGWTLISCGLVGWSRRPESRVGVLTLATGFCWFLGNFAGAENAVIAWIAGQTIFLYRGPLFHLVLGYPGGRVSSRLDRAAVATGYAAACLPTVWTTVATTVALASLLVTAGALDYLHASGPARRARLPALYAASAVGLVLAGQALARLVVPSVQTDELTRLALEVVLCAVAVGLLASLLATSRERATVTDLVVELGARQSATLRSELARSLGDPTLTVGYWLPAAGAYVDAEGSPIVLPAEDPRRAVTLVGSEREPIAALVHDPAVLDDPVLLEAAARAMQLAAENARLQADVRSRLAELEASRRRIVAAGEAEREDLEQRLHDGAERLLEQLAGQLRSGRLAARVPETRGRIELAEARLADALVELRELAAGLYPRIVSERGLEGALGLLAERSPVPVSLTVSAGRLPPEVEAVAYFVCSEALANIAKHASASRVAVSVGSDDGSVDVTVADDGVGGADPALGTGLRGLADRIEALGGTLRVESEPGHGTRLVARVPYVGDAR